MAVVEQKPTEMAEPKESAPRYRVKPKYGVWTEENKVILQVALPGVSKESIKMKALEDYFTLRARREEILYALDLDFGVKLEPGKTHAEYKEGLLKIEFTKYNPLEHAYEVKIE